MAYSWLASIYSGRLSEATGGKPAGYIFLARLPVTSQAAVHNSAGPGSSGSFCIVSILKNS